MAEQKQSAAQVASPREQLRIFVRGAYDLQKLRIQTGNRIAANFRAKLGQKPGESAKDSLEEDAAETLAIIKASYRRVTDGIVGMPKPKTFTGDAVISSYTELVLVAEYMELEAAEARHFRRMESLLGDYAIWTGWLSDVRGIGPAMAGVLISEIDIAKARYPSSIWRYAGLDVAADGRGRSRRKEHLRTVQYRGADGEQHERAGITYNPFLKAKLMGVLAPSLLRCGSPYRQHYDEYKHRMESHAVYGVQNDAAEGAEVRTSKGRRHMMAMRYMVKRFLVDLYTRWREMEGLPVEPPWHVAKGGHVHHRVEAAA
jgi:hypothetical protein